MIFESIVLAVAKIISARIEWQCSVFPSDWNPAELCGFFFFSFSEMQLPKEIVLPDVKPKQ